MNFKTFGSLARYLSSVPCINNGGCGFAAYFIEKFFKEEGKTPEITYLYEDGNPRYDDNNEALKDSTKKARACSHVMVKVDGKYYDADGEHEVESVERWYENHSVFPEEFLIRSLKNKGEWNSMFDRKNLPKMEKKIGINLPVM